MMYKRYQSNILGSTYFNWADGLHNNNSRLISGVDNPDLTFEKVKNINLGIEGYFFNKSLAIDANAFYIKNSGIIVQMTDTYSSLLSSYIPYKNYEANSHTGAEVGINWMETMGDFSFNIGGNLIYRTSNADKRDEIYPNDFQYRAGHPVTSIFTLNPTDFDDEMKSLPARYKQRLAWLFQETSNTKIRITMDTLQKTMRCIWEIPWLRWPTDLI